MKKAYKVFNSDWTCRGFAYEVGRTYHQEGEIKACVNGFHACESAVDCFNYYSFDPENKVAEVQIFGIIDDSENDKICGSDIRIVREISWQELLTIVNTGKACTGNRNSGDSNSGNSNSGDSNSGDSNSGNRNSGNRNSGDSNSGNWNSGNRNSGDSNSGNWNSGDSNSGNWNSGDSNSGNWNSGDWNSGLFNSDEPNMRMFNQSTCYKRKDIDIPSFLYFDLTQWVSHDTATEEEKNLYKKEIETCGGFLKKIEYKDAFRRAWVNASQEDKEKVKSLPNFDADIFLDISGIDLRKDK